MKILFVAAEGAPFAKTGGLGDVIGALPKSLVKNGHEVAVILHVVCELLLQVHLFFLAPVCLFLNYFYWKFCLYP